MNGGSMLVVGLLVSAAALVAWPVRTIRARRRRVLALAGGTVGADPDDALVQWVRELGRLPGDLPTSGWPTAVSPSATAGGQTLAARSTRDTVSGTNRVGVAGGSTRPPGPARPPTRRDPRRPAGPARPGAVILDAVPRADGSGAVPLVAVGQPDVDRQVGQSVRLADGRRTLDEGEPFRSAPATATVGEVGDGDPRVADAVREDGGSRAAGGVRGARPARVLLLVCLAGAGVGAVAAGPVAGVAVGGYGTLVVRGLLRRRANRRAERVRRRGLDQLCGLAADLRAGLPVPPTIDIASTGGSDRLRQLTSAAVRLADRTGAPLAELVERIEADARATDRGLAAAAAQAAGARATAWLLAALPVGGIGLGYGIGVDPVAVLLHDTVGGICAIVAVALQVVGLLWAERLGATPGQAA